MLRLREPLVQRILVLFKIELTLGEGPREGLLRGEKDVRLGDLERGVQLRLLFFQFVIISQLMLYLYGIVPYRHWTLGWHLRAPAVDVCADRPGWVDCAPLLVVLPQAFLEVLSVIEHRSNRMKGSSTVNSVFRPL